MTWASSGTVDCQANPSTRAFNRQLEELIARENSDPIEVRDARNRALTMVEWEWDNRGLGGFRGWCSSEGEAAVERFSN